MVGTRSIRYILYGQLSFLTAFIFCLLLNHDEVLSHNGFSFYGNFVETIVPYAIGLGLCAWFLGKAADEIPQPGRQAGLLRLVLRVTAISLLGLMLTPSFASKPSAFMHVFFGSIMYGTQAFAAWQLFAKWWQNPIDRALLILQLVATAAVLLSFRRIGILDVMMPAQVAELIGFGLLCMRTIGRLEPESRAMPVSSNLERGIT